MLKNTRGPEGLSSKGEQLLRFDIDTDPMELDVSRVPARLRELPPLDLKAVVRTHTNRDARV
ncbi:MAG: hypothetical protein Q8S71_10475 [Hydrogenophaga sp.]|jgi:hypothetical protein|uniref:hypothetical protein n=1 Tax=Hydrogenophaga sp. TaxID=1904254 RepID=UPI00271C3DF8|nr:hypothetical protein [Hydrogenophaga sp.]MDO9132187.1 hypothetical protein [Hydrogenophaga sp.]MDP2406117.1 hypothetical protein [Hydrogenophaga sp.]MDP3323956.1 hypothetical protein [Hydrogenophaga sp.]MDZ4175489.1 hypothetical protein [Hydrogenophaga sp.]